MIQTTESPYPFSAVGVSALPGGGSDVWLRRDIATVTREAPEGGEAYTVHTATEAFLRTSETITPEQAQARFDELWELAAAYNPATDKQPTPTEQWQTDTDAALVELAGILDELMGGM